MNEDKIIIEIASYCDPELLNTVNSAIIQADFPDRVYFSICYQDDETEDLEKLKKIKNCKVKWLKIKEAKGVCYARYLCDKMIDDEKYVFQVDSHMRFVKHWDTKMIEELLSINDPKAIISFYPSTCTEEMLTLPLYDKTFDCPGTGGIMYVGGFHEGDTPFVKRLCQTVYNDDPKNHLRSVFIGAGNFFSFADAHREVRHNPDLFFYGDELFMDIKLFTYGWNVYNSNQCYVFHQYNRKNRKFTQIDNAADNEKNQLIELLQHKNNKAILKKYDIGNVRTIDEFEKFAGIDFKNRIIYMNAETGELENKDQIGKISYISNKESEYKKQIKKKHNIEVLIVDLFEDYEECITKCLEKTAHKDRVKFIVGSTMKAPTKNKQKELNIKKFITYDKDKRYCEILNELSENTGNCFVAIVDSSVRFTKGWDNYYSENLIKCGKNAVLTSWVWKSTEEEIFALGSYINIEMKVTGFNNYLPILEYNDSINILDYNAPYQTYIIYDGFIFTYSNIIKKVKVDPNLSYQEHLYLYSLRLWTNGIDVYLPISSFVARCKDEYQLNTDNNNTGIVCSLSGLRNYYSKTIESHYPYDVGNDRPLWTWYKKININYDENEKDIKQD